MSHLQTSVKLCMLWGMTRARKHTAERPNLALCYVRVSTGRQAESGLSLDAQERRVIAEAEAAGYAVEIVREEGRSGKDITGRPLLGDALARLNAGEAAALYVAKLDRLSRSAHDALSVRTVAERNGWRLVVTELGADTATPQGRLMFTLMSGVAEMELDTIRERHRAWHAEARQRGKVWGRDYGPRTAVPAHVLDRIADERNAGRSMQAIAAGLTADGIPTSRGGKWHPSTIAALLRSPALLGRAS